MRIDFARKIVGYFSLLKKQIMENLKQVGLLIVSTYDQEKKIVCFS